MITIFVIKADVGSCPGHAVVHLEVKIESEKKWSDLILFIIKIFSFLDRQFLLFKDQLLRSIKDFVGLSRLSAKNFSIGYPGMQ